MSGLCNRVITGESDNNQEASDSNVELCKQQDEKQVLDETLMVKAEPVGHKSDLTLIEFIGETLTVKAESEGIGPDVTPNEAEEKDKTSFAQNLFDTKIMRLLSSAGPPPTLDPRPQEVTESVEGSTGLICNGEVIARETQKGLKGKSAAKPKPHLPIYKLEAFHRGLPQQQRKAYQLMHADFMRAFDGSVLKEIVNPHTDTLRVPNTNHVLPYFSFLNLRSLRHGTLKTGLDDDEIDIRGLTDVINRPMPHFNQSQAYAGGSSRITCYIQFARRSIGYVCNTPSALMRSFVEWREIKNKSSVVRSHPLETIVYVFGLLLDNRDVFKTLLSNSWTSLDVINRPRFDAATLNMPEYCNAREASETRKREQNDHSGAHQTLSDTEAAHVAKIVLAVLISHVGNFPSETLVSVVHQRRRGHETTGGIPPDKSRPVYDGFLELMDKFEDEAAVTLATRLARVLGSRRWEELVLPRGSQPHDSVENSSRPSNFMTLLVRNLADCEGLPVVVQTGVSPASVQGGIDYQHSKRRVFAGQKVFRNQGKCIAVEWMRAIIIKHWNGKAEVPRRSAIGGALEFLKHMCKYNTPEGRIERDHS